MAKRERNKRAARKARQKERARVEEARAIAAENEKPTSRSFFKGSSNKSAKKPKAKAKSVPKQDRKGIQKVTGYFGDVRAEMRQVTWPNPVELRNYSVAVIGALIVIGVAVWLIDTGFVAALVQYTNLRG